MNSDDSPSDNRLTVTRSASLGLELEIDLSRTSRVQDVVDVVATPTLESVDSPSNNLRGWMPMTTILERLGLRHLAKSPQVLEIQLRDGTIARADMGTADENTSLAEWLDRGRVVRDGQVIMELVFEQTSAVEAIEGNRFTIRDYTTPPQQAQTPVDVSIRFGDGENEGFNDPRPLAGAERSTDLPPSVTTVGQARRWVIEQVEAYLESLFLRSYDGETWNFDVAFPSRLPASPTKSVSQSRTAIM
jgi:hypothetical protein